MNPGKAQNLKNLLHKNRKKITELNGIPSKKRE